MYEAYYFFNLGDASDVSEAAAQVGSLLSCSFEQWEHAPRMFGCRLAGFHAVLTTNGLRDEPGLSYEEYRYKLHFILPRPSDVYTPLMSALICIVVRRLFEGPGAAGMVTTDWANEPAAKYESRTHEALGKPELYDVLLGKFVCDVPSYATTLLTLPS